VLGNGALSFFDQVGNYYWYYGARVDLYYNTITTGIEDRESIVFSYSLSQNYPNPFNPTTTIQYELPQRSDVRISIYDLLGKQVVILISESQDAGYKSVIWDATNDQGQPVSAGVYFYQIKAGDFVQTREMILLK